MSSRSYNMSKLLRKTWEYYNDNLNGDNKETLNVL